MLLWGDCCGRVQGKGHAFVQFKPLESSNRHGVICMMFHWISKISKQGILLCSTLVVFSLLWFLFGAHAFSPPVAQTEDDVAFQSVASANLNSEPSKKESSTAKDLRAHPVR